MPLAGEVGAGAVTVAVGVVGDVEHDVIPMARTRVKRTERERIGLHI
jgi:hypothetical protein